MKKRVFLIAAALLGCVSLRAQEQPQTINLTLQQAIEIAITENPTIKIADMEIQRQDYARKETIGNLLPSLSASGQYIYAIKKQEMAPGVSFGADNTVNFAGDLSVPLFVPAVYASLKLNKAQIENAVEAARSSRINMVKEVKNSFYQILMLEQSLSVLNESEKLAQEVVNDTRIKFNAELVAEYDLLTAEVNLNNIRPNVIQTEGALNVSKILFKTLLGLPGDTNVTLSGSFNEYAEYISETPIDLDYNTSNNSTLRTLEIQEKLLEGQLKLVNAQRLPTLAAFGQYTIGGSDPSIPMFGVPKEFRWQQPINVGLSLSVPIFTGNKINNQAKQAKIAIEQIRLNRQYAEESTIAQVKNAATSLMTAKGRMESTAKVMTQAKKAYNITNTRYKAEAGTILELNSAQLQLTQSQLNYNQAIYDYLAAYSDYEAIIGAEYIVEQPEN